MKTTLEKLLTQALSSLQESGVIPAEQPLTSQVERCKDTAHGDFATNLALSLAKACRMPPRQLAEHIVAAIPDNAMIKSVHIAGPGFINFHLQQDVHRQIISQILEQKENFGSAQVEDPQHILLEFVSANPTGPLHVGHGRGAAFGATLANILAFYGHKVSREYYVNDAGRQMNILAVSVWLRYLSLAGEPIRFPDNGYRGDYVLQIAESLWQQQGAQWQRDWSDIAAGLPLDESEGGDKERYIDALVQKARQLLGTQGFQLFHRFALDAVLRDIRDDLGAFGVTYDHWFSEQSLADSKAIEQGIAVLREQGHTYEQNGALWFRATAFGDEKDRVLLRANGESTYFASDVAYHWNKYERGYDRVIDIFGADHHGYISRVRAAVNALGKNDQALTVLLVQFAILYRGGERVQMSTRSGSFVTLRELRSEVGNDAARFFYVARKPEQHMDFDLDLAKSQSNDNPVYYIQYAHARICSVLRQLAERGYVQDDAAGLAHLDQLTAEQERHLMTLLNRFPETIKLAAEQAEPHLLAYYLRELANGLHSYYNAVVLLCDNEALRHARMTLLMAVRQCLANGLGLLGVSAPERM
ncbi:MAG: arginine--tRNA ligase [Legionellaceae bacterium]|nr:arginine--tRNA ligase [Legionellaceae bacterium]